MDEANRGAMNINKSHIMMRALLLILCLVGAGCSELSVGYIQILGEAQDVTARFERAEKMIASDFRFVPYDYSTPYPEWVRKAKFSLRQYQKNYDVILQANTNTGDLVVLFFDLSGNEMSSSGVREFESLVTRAQFSFGKENVISGMDDEMLRALNARFQ